MHLQMLILSSGPLIHCHWIGAQADIYRQHMDYFLDQRMDGNMEDQADWEALIMHFCAAVSP